MVYFDCWRENVCFYAHFSRSPHTFLALLSCFSLLIRYFLRLFLASYTLKMCK